MTLNILKASDPVSIETLILLLYGDPGAGKSSLAQTAADPLTLDFDRGVHRSHFRRDSVPVTSWDDIESMTPKDLEPYSTIAVDTVGRALDEIALSIIARDPKMATGAGALTLQGYGALKAEFAAWMRRLRSYGKDVILIAHGTEKESGDTLILRPEITGSSYGEVFKQADGVGYLRMEGRKRVLEWDPQERSVGKNPAGLEKAEVPNLAQAPDYMANLIAQIKAAIGQISEEGKAIAATVTEWQGKIAETDKAPALTKLVKGANSDLAGSAQKQVKALIAERSRELGLTWDSKTGAFAADPKKEESGADAPAKS